MGDKDDFLLEDTDDFDEFDDGGDFDIEDSDLEDFSSDFDIDDSDLENFEENPDVDIEDLDEESLELIRNDPELAELYESVVSDQDDESSDSDAEDMGVDSAFDTDELDDTEDYSDGVLVDRSELLKDKEEEPEDDNVSDEYLSLSGDIVVMQRGAKDAFKLEDIPIANICVTNRIRKKATTAPLLRSIQSTGLLCPIVVAPLATDGMYVLIDGWLRVMACAKAGMRTVPCIVNTKITTTEIPVIEAMYNHKQAYTMNDVVEYIEYLEKQKGIMNPSMIEYLLQLNDGDYTKLKDILNDNDEDIVPKLMEGVYTIDMAFKKLEQRRKKESNEEKQAKKADKIYTETEESGVDAVEDSGITASDDEDTRLSDDEVQSLLSGLSDMNQDIEDKDLKDMIEEDKKIEGFGDHKQNTGEREYIDPAIKKACLARDNYTCQACMRGGPQYSDVLDFHHVVPVFLGGADNLDNGVMLCVACHRMVHLYSTGDLIIDNDLTSGKKYGELSDSQKERYINEEIFEDEKRKFKKIVYLGGKIRKGMEIRGIKRDEYKKQHNNNGIGRNLPGKGLGKQTRA